MIFVKVSTTSNMDSLKTVTSESCSSHLKYYSNEMCFAKNNEKFVKTAFRIIMMLQRKTTQRNFYITVAYHNSKEVYTKLIKSFKELELNLLNTHYCYSLLTL